MSDVPDRRRRSWTELPDEVTVSIDTLLGTIDLVTAHKVCTTWRRICKKPSMWSKIDMSNKWCSPVDQLFNLEKMCRLAIDRSCGTLVQIKLQNFGNEQLLNSRGLRSLQLVSCYIGDKGFSEVAARLSLLEELEITECAGFISHKTVKLVGQACPLLKSLKLNFFKFIHSTYRKDDLILSLPTCDDLRKTLRTCDKEAVAISRTMQGLHHLKLVSNRLTNHGLRKIIDSCTKLESLDLRGCPQFNLSGDLGRRCAEQIKSLLLPTDPFDHDDYLSFSTVKSYITPYLDLISRYFDEEEDDNDDSDDDGVLSD